MRKYLFVAIVVVLIGGAGLYLLDNPARLQNNPTPALSNSLPSNIYGQQNTSSQTQTENTSVQSSIQFSASAYWRQIRNYSNVTRSNALPPNGYFSNVGNVYFIGAEDTQGHALTPKADLATFVELKSFYPRYNPYGFYGKDKSHVWIGTDALTAADAATFEPIIDATGRPTPFLKDKNHVFTAQGLIADSQVLAGADPAAFQVIYEKEDQFYGKDKNHVYVIGQDYLGGGVFKGVDPATFVLITDAQGNRTGYEKDKSQVYAMDNLLQAADPATFAVLTNYDRDTHQQSYAKDKNNVYFINSSYGNLDGGFYYSVVTGADPLTFEVTRDPSDCYNNLPHGCSTDAQDKNHKYINGQIVR